MKRNATPIRTCIGCRAKRPDDELVRVSVPGGAVAIGRGPGRGAWLCPTESCIEDAVAAKAFSRALRSKLADRVCADTLLGWLGKPAH